MSTNLQVVIHSFINAGVLAGPSHVPCAGKKEKEKKQGIFLLSPGFPDSPCTPSWLQCVVDDVVTLCECVCANIPGCLNQARLKGQMLFWM